MYIPEKAIITAKTEYEAERLLDFLTENGYTWFEDATRWSRYGEDTCYNLEADKRVMFCDHNFYETEIERMEDGDPDSYDTYGFIPEDPALRFIATDAFIALCNGYEEDTGDVDISDLM